MKTIVFACENGFGMSRGSFCTNSQLRALRKWRILMCFGIFCYMFYVLHVFLCIFIENDLFCSFWGSGDVKNSSSMYFSSYLIWLNSDFNHFWSYILYFIPEKEPGPTWEEPLCTRTPGTHGPNIWIDIYKIYI